MSESTPIFVSYARSDSDRVLRIINDLEAHGFRFWVDQDGIYGASVWRTEIVQAITRAPLVLFFASHASCASDNVAKELTIASEERKPILPVFIDNVKPDAGIRYQIAGVQHLDWRANPGRAMERLKVLLPRYNPDIELADDSLKNVKRASERRTLGKRHITVRLILVLASLVVAAGLYAYIWSKQEGNSRRSGDISTAESSGSKSQVLFGGEPPANQSSAILRALIIGNGTYKHLPISDNPLTSAHLMREFLKRRGFEVFELYDGTRTQTLALLAQYGATKKRNDSSNSTEGRLVCFIYYAGYGFQYKGVDYIAPVDCEGDNEYQIERDAIPLDTLFANGGARKGPNRIVLFGAQSGATGFEEARKSYSPLTSALLEYLRDDTLDIRGAFMRIVRDVVSQTDNAQRPEFYDSLLQPLSMKTLSSAVSEDTTTIAIFDACRGPVTTGR